VGIGRYDGNSFEMRLTALRLIETYKIQTDDVIDQTV